MGGRGVGPPGMAIVIVEGIIYESALTMGRRTVLTLRNRQGDPITNEAQARKIIAEYVRAQHPRKRKYNVRVAKYDGNGKWSVTI